MTRFSLKVLAVILMVLEHSSELISFLSGNRMLGIATHYPGRWVFPIFVFLMVDGFFKTSNRINYIRRIFLWGAITSMGGLLLLYSMSYYLQVDPETLFGSPVWLYRILSPIKGNIFLSLGMGMLVLSLIEQLKTDKGIKKLASYILLPLLCFATPFMDTIHVLPLFLIFYFLYNKKKYTIVVYILYSLIWLVNGLFNIKYFWSFEYQWVMIFAVPFFLLYNGDKGKYELKHLFYLIYPLHLWIIFIIERLYVLS